MIDASFIVRKPRVLCNTPAGMTMSAGARLDLDVTKGAVRAA
jgi:hypothetical protein